MYGKEVFIWHMLWQVLNYPLPIAGTQSGPAKLKATHYDD